VLFVKGSLPTQRFLTAVQMQKPELTESLSRELWMRIWHRVIAYVFLELSLLIMQEFTVVNHEADFNHLCCTIFSHVL